MGRAFYRAIPANMVEDFETGGYLYHALSDRHYRMIRRGDRYFLRRYQAGFNGKETNVMEAEIHYVIGSGNHARSYLHRTAENRLVQMPVSWYPANGGYLAMSPGYDNAAHLDFRRKITYDCFFCHNAYPNVPAGGDLAGADPVFPHDLPEGIDCQRCHGPGRAHIEAAQRKRPAEEIRAGIVNPARLTIERQLEVCMQCHLETTSFPLPNSIQRYERGAFSYRPGEPLGDYMLHFDHATGSGREDKFEIVSAAYRLLQSACFEKSGGKLLCTTCHNPHDVPRGEKAVAHYSAACGQCHQEALAPRIAAGIHPAGADCIECHMPRRRTEDVVHATMTDHRILRRKPARDLLAPRAERQEIEGVSYQGEVVLHYPPALPPSPDRDLYLAFAQVAQKSNLKAGIAQLEAALRAHQPTRPEFYFELAQAYANEGASERAIAQYRAALARDPKYAPAMRGLASALLKTGDAAAALIQLESARAIDPGDAQTLHELGRAYYQLGRRADAVSALEAALRSDPDMPEVHDTLGNVLLEMGRPDRAEASLREAIRRQPDFSSAHNNLGNALVARNNFEEAEYHFRQSVSLAPSNAVARYSYGAALASRGRFDEAQTQIEAAVKLKPDFGEAQEILGNLYARKGDWARAVRPFREAVRVRPQFGRARLGLGMALAATGDVAGARAHLSQAASDPDAAVRADASELLRSIPAGR
ncbi:MAG: tetratricopeptide repeat protein [Bryobacteraceae bacterium]|nr:tetratricopeptide repeat protein [Bryobacteraceae bacterium]